MMWNEWEWMVHSIDFIMLTQIVHSILIVYIIRCLKNK